MNGPGTDILTLLCEQLLPALALSVLKADP